MNKTVETKGSETTKPPAETAKHGQGIRADVDVRKHELQMALAHARKDQSPSPHLDAIETALHAFDDLLTGDLENIPEVVAAKLSQWLESSKFLIEHKGKRASVKH